MYGKLGLGNRSVTHISVNSPGQEIWQATKLELTGDASGAIGIINASSAIPVFLARRLSVYNKDCCRNSSLLRLLSM